MKLVFSFVHRLGAARSVQRPPSALSVGRYADCGPRVDGRALRGRITGSHCGSVMVGRRENLIGREVVMLQWGAHPSRAIMCTIYKYLSYG